MESFEVSLTQEDVIRQAKVEGGIIGVAIGVTVTSLYVMFATRRHLEKTYPEDYKHYLTRK